MAIDFPNSPTTNQEFTSAGRTWVYDGAKWGAKTTQGNLVADAPPATAAQGQIWVNSNTARSYVYLDSTWVEIANNAGGGSGSENAIINGAFEINQRGVTSQTLSSGTDVFSADRFKVISTNEGTGSSAFSLENFSGTESPIKHIGTAKYISITTGGQTNAASNYVQLSQKIEGGKTYSGSLVTFSFWARTNVGTTNIVAESQQYELAGNTQRNTYFGTATLTTAWTRFSYTATLYDIPAVDPVLDFLRMVFWLSAGSNWAARTNSLGIQNNKNVQITGVQLELGSVATTFHRNAPSIQAELAACQRYYEAGTVCWTGNTTSGSTYYYGNNFRTTKRAVPTMTFTQDSAFGFPTTIGQNLATIDGFIAYYASNNTVSGGYNRYQYTASAEL